MRPLFRSRVKLTNAGAFMSSMWSEARSALLELIGTRGIPTISVTVLLVAVRKVSLMLVTAKESILLIASRSLSDSCRTRRLVGISDAKTPPES